MKYWMSLCFLLIATWSQAQLIRISGHISHQHSPLVRIQDQTGTVMDTAMLNAAGQFELAFEGPGGEYTFYTHRETSAMYLQPGDELRMELDVDSFDESISYSGTGADVNNYLAQHYLLEEGLADKGSISQLVQLEEADFLHRLDSISELKHALLHRYALAPRIQERMELALDFDHRYALSIYPRAHAYWTKTDHTVSEDYPDPFEGLDVNRGDLASMHEYIEIVNAFIQHELDTRQIGEEDALVHRLQVIEEKINDPILREQLVQSQAPYLMMHSSAPEQAFVWYKRLSGDSLFLAEREQQLQGLRAIGPGMSSPEFSIPDSGGMEHRLAELRGSYVYIDIWATWCGPCMREVPHFKKLYADYRDKNIRFVGIAMNDNYDRWKQAVANIPLDGLQVFSDQEDRDFFDTYMVYSIPRYILLDPEGRIVNANAPRPSEEALRELLDEVLGE